MKKILLHGRGSIAIALVIICWFSLFQIETEQGQLLLIIFVFVGYFILFDLDSPTGIHKAVLNRDISKIEKYLEEGTDIDLLDVTESTSLMLTVYQDLPDMAEFLLSKGADVNYNLENPKGLTPLYLSVVRQRHEITNILLASGAILDLYSASFLGKAEIIKEYLEQSEKPTLNHCEQKTLLHMAAWNNQLEIAKLLIDSQADVNSQDRDNKTPLHFAASHPDAKQLVELLIAHGAKPNIIARSIISDGDSIYRGGAPLHIAARSNHADIAKVLIDGGADVNITYSRGKTPLHSTILVNRANLDVAQVLIANGADFNAYETFQGETPLHQAAYWGHTSMARLLLESGAKVNFRNFARRTPFANAEARGGSDLEMYSLLVKYGARL